jgi:hypothetical protein
MLVKAAFAHVANLYRSLFRHLQPVAVDLRVEIPKRESLSEVRPRFFGLARQARDQSRETGQMLD